VDQAADKLSVISVPRDLSWDGSPSRIDMVLGTEGPSALIEQLESHLGIGISHYVELDEPGLAALIDEVGGVRLDSLSPIRDVQSGVDLPAGCSTLDGAMTVALARSRHLERRDDNGTWSADPTGDLGREMRQRVLILALVQELRSMPVDTSAFSTLLDVFADHTTVDAGFSRNEMLDLARWFHGSLSGRFYAEALPVTPFVSSNGADGLVMNPDQDREMVLQFLGGTLPSSTTTVPPAADGGDPGSARAITLIPC